MFELLYDTEDSELDQYINKFVIINFKVTQDSNMKLSVCSKIYKKSNNELIAIKYYDQIKEKYFLEILNNDYLYDIDELNIKYDELINSEEVDKLGEILNRFQII